MTTTTTTTSPQALDLTAGEATALRFAARMLRNIATDPRDHRTWAAGDAELLDGMLARWSVTLRIAEAGAMTSYPTGDHDLWVCGPCYATAAIGPAVSDALPLLVGVALADGVDPEIAPPGESAEDCEGCGTVEYGARYRLVNLDQISAI